MKVEIFGCLICSGIIFFIIGLPTFLMGCNPSVSDNCVAYNLFSGTIYKKNIYEKTCSRCNHKNANGNCISYSYYSCWDAYVYAETTNNTESRSTCYIQTASEVRSEYHAKQTTNKYNYGSDVDWYRNKGTQKCNIGTNVATLWYVGIVFLSAVGFCIVICLGIFAFDIFNTFISNNDVFPTGKNLDIV